MGRHEALEPDEEIGKATADSLPRRRRPWMTFKDDPATIARTDALRAGATPDKAAATGAAGLPEADTVDLGRHRPPTYDDADYDYLDREPIPASRAEPMPISKAAAEKAAPRKRGSFWRKAGAGALVLAGGVGIWSATHQGNGQMPVAPNEIKPPVPSSSRVETNTLAGQQFDLQQRVTNGGEVAEAPLMIGLDTNRDGKADTSVIDPLVGGVADRQDGNALTASLKGATSVSGLRTAMSGHSLFSLTPGNPGNLDKDGHIAMGVTPIDANQIVSVAPLGPEAKLHWVTINLDPSPFAADRVAPPMGFDQETQQAVPVGYRSGNLDPTQPNIATSPAAVRD